MNAPSPSDIPVPCAVYLLCLIQEYGANILEKQVLCGTYQVCGYEDLECQCVYEIVSEGFAELIGDCEAPTGWQLTSKWQKDWLGKACRQRYETPGTAFDAGSSLRRAFESLLVAECNAYWRFRCRTQLGLEGEGLIESIWLEDYLSDFSASQITHAIAIATARASSWRKSSSRRNPLRDAVILAMAEAELAEVLGDALNGNVNLVRYHRTGACPLSPYARKIYAFTGLADGFKLNLEQLRQRLPQA